MPNTSDENSPVGWLSKHWFLFTALVICGAAWGQAQYKINTLEDAVKSSTEVTARVNELKAQSERVDERTRAIQDSQVRQERMIEMLIMEQRQSRSLDNISSKVRRVR